MKKLKGMKSKNVWTGGILGASVIGIYIYSMFAVKQEDFLNEVESP